MILWSCPYQRENHSMAEPAFESSLSVHISGRRPLQGEGKPSVPNQGGVCGSGHHHGWHERYPWCVDWGAREQQILAECVERPQKQRSFGRISVLCGRFDRLCGGHRGGLSPQLGAAVHCPSDPRLHPLCEL